MNHSKHPWDHLNWHRQRIDERTPETDQPLVCWLGALHLKILSGVLAGGPGHALEVMIPGGRHIFLGKEKLIYYAALAIQNELALRPGVPARPSLDRYSHHIWLGLLPSNDCCDIAPAALSKVVVEQTEQWRVALAMGRGKRFAGCFARSANGTLRFSTDDRDYYEHRDELHLWKFAPLTAGGSGGVVPGWADNERQSHG